MLDGEDGRLLGENEREKNNFDSCEEMYINGITEELIL